MQNFWRGQEKWSYLGLFFLAAVYCNRYYGQDFAFEGDAPIHVYFLFHRDLVWLGYNPFQWDYYVSTSVNGLFNPVLQGIHLLLAPFFGQDSQVERALYTCMFTSWVLLGAVSSSVFWFLRKWGTGTWGAILGAVIVSYTGFHQVAVREFDHMYLVSLLTVPPILDLSYRVLMGQIGKLRGFAFLALWIGFSFLGGTSSPLFYYFSAMPIGMAILFWRQRLTWSQMGGRTAVLLGAGALGICIAAPVLFPSIQFMEETNRAVLDRFGPGLSMRFFLRTVFMRDWWNAQGHYQEYDVFLGLPVLILFLGAISARRWKVFPFAATFLIFGFLVILNGLLPKPISAAMAHYFNALSIAGAPRFLILTLLPIAAWAGWGLEDTERKPYLRMAVLLLAAQAFFLYRWWLYPPNGLPDLKVAMVLSLTAAGLATLLIMAQGFLRTRSVPMLIVGLVYLMYFFAPVQLTVYNDFYERFGLANNISTERLSFARQFGLHFEYDVAESYARATMLNVPDLLKDPATKEGRIFINGTTGLRGRYFAAASGHRFAYESARDPATPVRLFELIDMKAHGALDIYQVRWMLDRAPVAAVFERGVTAPYTDLQFGQKLVSRPQALPEFFLAGGFQGVADRSAVLAQMKSRQGRDFLGPVLVDCSETDCHALKSWEFQGHYDSASLRTLEIRTESSGHIVLTVPAGRPSPLFIGIPYHPAWTAVDSKGEEQKIIRANHAFMALPLSEKATEIRLKFDLKIRRQSLAIGLISLLLAFGLVLSDRRKKPLPLYP